MHGYAASNPFTVIVTSIQSTRKSSRAGATVKTAQPVKADGDIWTI